jgi:hypothetical protein
MSDRKASIRCRNASASLNWLGPSSLPDVGGSYVDADTRARRVADFDDIVADRRCVEARVSPTVSGTERSTSALSEGEAGENSVCRRTWRDTNLGGGSGTADEVFVTGCSTVVGGFTIDPGGDGPRLSLVISSGRREFAFAGLAVS